MSGGGGGNRTPDEAPIPEQNQRSLFPEVGTELVPVLVINMWPHESECFVCGAWLIDCRQGVPCYEDIVLPNDWSGEWFGHDACVGCYNIQQLITEPLTRHQFMARFGIQQKERVS